MKRCDLTARQNSWRGAAPASVQLTINLEVVQEMLKEEKIAQKNKLAHAYVKKYVWEFEATVGKKKGCGQAYTCACNTEYNRLTSHPERSDLVKRRWPE